MMLLEKMTDLSASIARLKESEELNTPITEEAGESSLADQKNLRSTLCLKHYQFGCF